ncbi:MAG: pyridoxamine 5'-phosphate oxidase family protein [ANME-2 cluster archaeon]|nr:pyridoxamine 5'-phosphate oxidase family protein [ANME-2 cluster archaeon]
MAELPDDAVKMFSNENCDKDKPLVWISTVSRDSMPYSVPVCFTRIIDNDKILIAVNFITKTVKNITMGSMVTASVAIPFTGYMVTGKGEIITSGDLFDDVAERVKARFGGKIESKAAILIQVQKIFKLTPTAGKKEIT